MILDRSKYISLDNYIFYNVIRYIDENRNDDSFYNELVNHDQLHQIKTREDFRKKAKKVLKYTFLIEAIEVKLSKFTFIGKIKYKKEYIRTKNNLETYKIKRDHLLNEYDIIRSLIDIDNHATLIR